MKRKNKQRGTCGFCGEETWKGWYKGNTLIPYCGCQGVRAGGHQISKGDNNE